MLSLPNAGHSGKAPPLTLTLAEGGALVIIPGQVVSTGTVLVGDFVAGDGHAHILPNLRHLSQKYTKINTTHSCLET